MMVIMIMIAQGCTRVDVGGSNHLITTIRDPSHCLLDVCIDYRLPHMREAPLKHNATPKHQDTHRCCVQTRSEAKRKLRDRERALSRGMLRFER